MSELKPCPFCKSDKLAVSYDGQPARFFFVKCMTCGAEGPRVQAASPVSGGYMDPWNAWNLRADHAAEVERLQERVRVLEEAVRQTPHDVYEYTGKCESRCPRCKLNAALPLPQPPKEKK